MSRMFRRCCGSMRRAKGSRSFMRHVRTSTMLLFLMIARLPYYVRQTTTFFSPETACLSKRPRGSRLTKPEQRLIYSPLTIIGLKSNKVYFTRCPFVIGNRDVDCDEN